MQRAGEREDEQCVCVCVFKGRGEEIWETNAALHHSGPSACKLLLILCLPAGRFLTCGRSCDKRISALYLLLLPCQHTHASWHFLSGLVHVLLKLFLGKNMLSDIRHFSRPFKLMKGKLME